jgi:hypothetical protein
MAYQTDLKTTDVLTTTGIRKRDVSDTIRHLYPSASMMPLISNGSIKGIEGVTKEKGLIGKRKVKSSKFEAFTFTPPAIEFTVTSYSAGTLVLVSNAGLIAKYPLVNSRTGLTCIIDTITAGGTTVEVTSYGDGGTFDASAGDKLIVLSPHYEEKSANPGILMKDPDNLFNYTFIHRNAVGVSGTFNQSDNYGGNRYEYIKKENAVDCMRKINHSLLFDNKPASGEKTTSGLSASFGSCDGMVNWSQTEFDFGGAMTYNSFMTEMPLTMHESVGADDPKIMFCGYEFWAEVFSWMNNGANIQVTPGSYEVYGVKSKKLLTCRGDIEVMVNDAYTRGSYKNQALIFNPENIDYVFYKERDTKLNENIQGNSVDGREDELIGEISICSNDNGYSIHQLKNAF